MPPKNEHYPHAARTLTATARYGVLSTVSVSEAGYPFGSITPYLIDGAGRITIYISLIAEHYRNLKADPRASLTVVDPFGGHDPQAHARATIVLPFAPVPESERTEVSRAYEARFPSSINYEIAHNFLFMRGEPLRVRWIGGFGEIGWIDGESFRCAAPDPLADSALDIIEHMNLDHAETLATLVRGLTDRDPTGGSVEMIGISSTDITLRLTRRGESSAITIPFPTPITPEGARAAVIALVRAAREKTP